MRKRMRRAEGRFRLSVALGAVALVVAALAGSASAIVGGSPDGNGHPYVGLAEGVYTTGAGSEHTACSGSLVSPTVMVTAGHCFDDGSTVSVTFDPSGATYDPVTGSYPLSGTVYTGTVHVMPGFSIGASPSLPGFDHNDVAVIEFSSPIPGIAPVQLPSSGYLDGLHGKQVVTLVGYGVSQFAIVPGYGPAPDVPQLYRQYAPADLIPSKDVISGEFLKLSSNTAQGKGGACFGDSGGPVLLDGQMLAIDSFGANPICNGNEYAQRIDTQAALAFIHQYAP